MCMDKLIIKGGFGEHGRSCFLFSFKKDRYCMLDCGILDTDPVPEPQVETELLKKTEYMFLSHCHKDHCGAFSWMREHGFDGTVIASKATMALSGIAYGKVLLLDDFGPDAVLLEESLSFLWGKSGHCPGSVWLEIQAGETAYVYSGDYQSRPFAYQCDRIKGRKADLAILDCAHPGTEENALKLRERLTGQIGEWLLDGHPVILPVPKYGRGMELIPMVRRAFPAARLACDERLAGFCMEMLAFSEWLQPEAERDIREFLREHPSERRKHGYDILFLSDPHLERQESREAVKEGLLCGAKVLITGRVKSGGYADRLLKEKQAIKLPYPHHQSMGDLRELMEENDFGVVVPFHSERKELYISTR